jgi:hypothetical protein
MQQTTRENNHTFDLLLDKAALMTAVTSTTNSE